MSVELILFVLRIVFIFALYFFILMVARVMSRELVSRSERGEAAMGAARSARGSATAGRSHLVIVDGADSGVLPGTDFSVISGTVVGRAPTADLRLNDPYTSSEHARFRYDRDRWLLDDLESMNGSYINGQRIRGTQPLADGDTVQLGRVVLQFLLRPPA